MLGLRRLALSGPLAHGVRFAFSRLAPARLESNRRDGFWS
jgi:hypothetical protein